MHFFQIIVGLQAHPELLARAEISGQPNGCARSNGSLAQHDLVDPARRHANFARQTILADRVGLEKLLEQYFSGVDVGQLGHDVTSTSMVIDDLDFIGVATGPDETEPPLLVDADAVPARSPAFECFEPIRRGDAQIV